MNDLIEASEIQQLNLPTLTLVDASGTPGAKERFEKEHISGALFIDLNRDLSDIKESAANGGRHPLPNPEQFGKVLGSFGIQPDTHVIIYDYLGGGNAAARLWWMLKAIGHEQVQVVNGGYNALKNANLPLATGPANTIHETTPYPSTEWQLKIASLGDVIAANQQKTQTIIDVRESRRFEGDEEPIDLIAGHIPHAINIPFMTNLDDSGSFKSAEELTAQYKELVNELENGQVIVHCGSGVTACHTILALAHAKLPLPALYVGSWSEWSRNDLPMTTKS